MPCTPTAGPAVPRHGQGMGKVPVPRPPPGSGFGGRRKAEEAGTLGPFHLSMGQHNQTLALCIDIPSGISGRINLCPGRSPPDTAGSWGWGFVLQSNAWLPLLLRDAADYLPNSFQLPHSHSFFLGTFFALPGQGAVRPNRKARKPARFRPCVFIYLYMHTTATLSLLPEHLSFQSPVGAAMAPLGAWA